MESNKKSMKTPDSDETARKSTEESEPVDETTDVNLQSSNKTGKHSSVEKLAASRPEFGASPGAKPVPGAFGDGAQADEEDAPSESHRDKALRSKL